MFRSYYPPITIFKFLDSRYCKKTHCLSWNIFTLSYKARNNTFILWDSLYLVSCHSPTPCATLDRQHHRRHGQASSEQGCHATVARLSRTFFQSQHYAGWQTADGNRLMGRQQAFDPDAPQLYTLRLSNASNSEIYVQSISFLSSPLFSSTL